jgi:hypothetical protein
MRIYTAKLINENFKKDNEFYTYDCGMDKEFISLADHNKVLDEIEKEVNKHHITANETYTNMQQIINKARRSPESPDRGEV